MLADLIFFVLMAIGRLNSYFTRSSKFGLGYQVFWYLLWLAIDSFLVACHVLNWWRQPFLTNVGIRMAISVILLIVHCTPPRFRSRTSWTFFILCIVHGILSSDLLRMSCFFAMRHPMHQLIPLVLFILFCTLNLGLMACRPFSKRTLGMRVCFSLLLSALFFFLMWRLFLYRYEFSSEHFLTTKDHILALQMLKAIDPFLEINQIIALFPKDIASKITWLTGHGAILSFLTPYLNMLSFVYPLQMDFEAIRRYPNLSAKQEPTFDELSIFVIPPFDRFKKARVKKTQFRDNALCTANRYYGWIIGQLQLMFAIAILINFSDEIYRFLKRFVITPLTALTKKGYGKVSDIVGKRLKRSKAKEE